MISGSETTGFFRALSEIGKIRVAMLLFNVSGDIIKKIGLKFNH